MGGGRSAQVREARAYLVRIVTRQSLNQLRTVSRRREDYVGEWLPEPLLTSPDVADDVELAENVSIAMLTVLETLAPTERAVFVLREVFDVPYDEIAEAVDKTPAAVRQIAHRARDHVAARHPRIRVERSEHEEVVDRLIAALNTGDVQGLMDVLAPDVVSVADGGGRCAARRGGRSSEPSVWSRYLMGGMAKFGRLARAWPPGSTARPARGSRSAACSPAAVSLTVENGRITRIYSIANPEKLVWLDAEAVLAR